MGGKEDNLQSHFKKSSTKDFSILSSINSNPKLEADANELEELLDEEEDEVESLINNENQNKFDYDT